MSKTKIKTNAFITATLAILLCLASLIGATFELFTSNTNDGTIGVITTAGNVKVDLVDSDTGDSLVGDVLNFKANRPNEYIYFEPGATYYTQPFCVENKGDVNINYKIYISKDDKLDIEEFKKAFDFWITTEPSNVVPAQPLMDFSGKLLAGHKSQPYYLVIKMKESAGNQFKNQTYSGIGITVYATQGNVPA